MSMTKLTANPMKSCRFHHNFSLGNTVQRRRMSLGMSVERTADLAGMQVSEWCALEDGWVPDTLCILRAVADTLELNALQLSFLAEISQPRPV